MKINSFCSTNFIAILTNKDLLEDLNANLDKLLPKLMELTPADSSKLPIITKRLKEFYLNGSNIIKEANGQGFINVSIHFVVKKSQQHLMDYLNYFSCIPIEASIIHFIERSKLI